MPRFDPASQPGEAVSARIEALGSHQPSLTHKLPSEIGESFPSRQESFAGIRKARHQLWLETGYVPPIAGGQEKTQPSNTEGGWRKKMKQLNELWRQGKTVKALFDINDLGIPVIKPDIDVRLRPQIINSEAFRQAMRRWVKKKNPPFNEEQVQRETSLYLLYSKLECYDHLYDRYGKGDEQTIQLEQEIYSLRAELGLLEDNE